VLSAADGRDKCHSTSADFGTLSPLLLLPEPILRNPILPKPVFGFGFQHRRMIPGYRAVHCMRARAIGTRCARAGVIRIRQFDMDIYQHDSINTFRIVLKRGIDGDRRPAAPVGMGDREVDTEPQTTDH